jgi:hypothetical protein
MLLQTCPAGPMPRNKLSSVPRTRCHTKSSFCTGESPGPVQGVGSCTSGKVEFGQDPVVSSWEAATSHWPFDDKF